MGRLQATCGARRSAVPCKQLRAFTSVCVQLRAFASVFERARSRLVAFGRVSSRLVAPKFFFRVRTRSGTFGRVLSSFLVILRPKMVFSGMAGNGLLRHRLGREGSSLLRVAPPRRGRRGKMAWHSFEIGMQLRQGRGCARSSCAQVYYKSGAFAVAGNSRVYLRMGERF